mmetsp:Transcript_108168/g.287989  ORF Transcript_108168/g.287989 Transcript_108168/m.287989 type:complete len:311 (+) Transcript_108168:405-1337(+)
MESPNRSSEGGAARGAAAGAAGAAAVSPRRSSRPPPRLALAAGATRAAPGGGSSPTDGPAGPRGGGGGGAEDTGDDAAGAGPSTMSSRSVRGGAEAGRSPPSSESSEPLMDAAGRPELRLAEPGAATLGTAALRCLLSSFPRRSPSSSRRLPRLLPSGDSSSATCSESAPSKWPRSPRSLSFCRFSSLKRSSNLFLEMPPALALLPEESPRLLAMLATALPDPPPPPVLPLEEGICEPWRNLLWCSLAFSRSSLSLSRSDSKSMMLRARSRMAPPRSWPSSTALKLRSLRKWVCSPWMSKMTCSGPFFRR